jgi:hypothetical protein
MVVVTFCKHQHKNLTVAWELYLFFPRLIFYCCHSLQYNIKNCLVVDIVVVALQSILSLVTCALAIVNVVSLHQPKVVCCLCNLAISLAALFNHCHCSLQYNLKILTMAFFAMAVPEILSWALQFLCDCHGHSSIN